MFMSTMFNIKILINVKSSYFVNYVLCRLRKIAACLRYLNVHIVFFYNSVSVTSYELNSMSQIQKGLYKRYPI